MATVAFKNPFRPGAGQLPPHLAGRQKEIEYFENNSLNQEPILSNLIITGLRGVGKTVLLETLKSKAISKGWIWAGADLSESASVSEQTFAIRILTDLATAVSSIPIGEEEQKLTAGFLSNPQKVPLYLTHEYLTLIYNNTPGLVSDKLKRVLEVVWVSTKDKAKGIVLAYDEAQNLKDQAIDKEYPLSVLLEISQYIQRKQMPYLLVLTGLPTLFPNLVEARTYSERMFHIMMLSRLDEAASREAIVKPIIDDNCPVHFSENAITDISTYSGGYPYFIQYICKEIYDSYIQQLAMDVPTPIIIFDEIYRKLDVDFYQGRWDKITDRQKELLFVISKLFTAEQEFTIKEIVEQSQKDGNEFKTSPLNLMLKSLIEVGLIYKNRHGKYSFAVPLFSAFIKRQYPYSINLDDFVIGDEIGGEVEAS